MHHRKFILIQRIIITFLIPIVISLPGFRMVIATSYSGIDIYWLPLLTALGLLYGDRRMVSQVFSDPSFILIVTGTVMFWVAWAYWFLNLLNVLSIRFNRWWAFILLAIFWINFSITLLLSNELKNASGALVSIGLIGACFVPATWLEIFNQSDKVSIHQSQFAPKPRFIAPGLLVVFGVIGVIFIGSVVSGLISQQLHQCGDIAVALNLTGCRVEYRDLSNNWAYIAKLSFTPDGRYLLTGGPIIEVDTGSQVALNSEPFSTLWHSAGYRDWRLKVKSNISGQIVFESEESLHSALATFSPSDKLFALARDESVELWQTSPWKLIAVLDTSASALAFSADDQLLATLTAKDPGDHTTPRTLKLWRLNDYSLLGATQTKGDLIEFSPDGTILAIAGQYLDITLLRVPDLGIVLTLPIEIEAQDIAFSPDGKLIASAEHQIVRIRALADSSTVCKFPVSDFSSSVAFSPDGTIFAWADSKGVQIWDWRRC